jgi:hypothetical protein
MSIMGWVSGGGLAGRLEEEVVVGRSFLNHF